MFSIAEDFGAGYAEPGRHRLGGRQQFKGFDASRS